MFAAPTGIQTVQRFLKCPGTASELGQSILSLRVKASIFFDKSARLCVTNEHGTSLALILPFAAERQLILQGHATPSVVLQELEKRMQSWALALPPLALVPAMRTNLIRELLTVKTMCCCTSILINSALPGQAHGSLPLNDKVAAAALEAADMLREVDLQSLQFVDTVCGVGISQLKNSLHC